MMAFPGYVWLDWAVTAVTLACPDSIKKGGRKTGRLGGEKGDIPRWGYPLP